MITAYLVLAIDTRSRSATDPTRYRQIGVGIYSEAHPTSAGHVYTTCLLKMTGHDYQSANDAIMREIYRSGPNAFRWVGELWQGKISGVGIENIPYEDAEREMLRWAEIAQKIKELSK